MKTRLIFWAIYFFAITFIYLAFYSDVLKKSEVKVKYTTVELLSDLEGVRHTAYKDSQGYWTIGIGHMIKRDEAHLKDAYLPPEKATTLLRKDLEPCQRIVKEKVRLPLSQPQFDALMSLCHNIGYDNFETSDVVKHLKRGNYRAAADSILHWNQPQELTKRRQKERQLFLSGA